MVEELAAEGYCCVLFNFRGCGPSGGSIDLEGWYEDLCSVVSRVHNTPGIDPSSIHCVAFSAGGAVAARHAAMEKHLQSLLLMATPENFADILPSDPGALREHFLRIGLIRDEDFPPDLETWYKGFLDLRPGMHLPFVSPRPVCIVHGDKDETVPPEHAERLHAAACYPKRLIMLPQAGHQLRKDPRAMPIIRDWLREVR
jgi:pimeloyl-ACP methyl ester carboxylesterase